MWYDSKQKAVNHGRSGGGEGGGGAQDEVECFPYFLGPHKSFTREQNTVKASLLV